MMNEDVLRAVNMFTRLSDSEKEVILQVVNRLLTSSTQQRALVTEDLKSFTTINFAPVPGVCPRCGK